jgi:hypothetical protein
VLRNAPRSSGRPHPLPPPRSLAEMESGPGLGRARGPLRPARGVGGLSPAPAIPALHRAWLPVVP